jgi:putative transposase
MTLSIADQASACSRIRELRPWSSRIWNTTTEREHRLLSWCVMPNHVHVVMYVSKGEALPRVVQRWKSFTAKRANEILGRAGAFWQPEYFDRIVRSEEDFVDTTEYVLNNPLKAGLQDWPWVSAMRS